MEIEQLANTLRTIVADELESKLESVTKALKGEFESKLEPVMEDLKEIKQTVGELKHQLNLLSTKQPEDTAAMLHIINDKLDSLTKDVEFVYLKVSMNELEINRLKAQ